METVVKPMALKGDAEKIKKPEIVGSAKHDIFFLGQPEKVDGAIGSDATVVEFGDGAHCASGALTYQNQRIFEWFAGIIRRR